MTSSSFYVVLAAIAVLKENDLERAMARIAQAAELIQFIFSRSDEIDWPGLDLGHRLDNPCPAGQIKRVAQNVTIYKDSGFWSGESPSTG